MAKRRQSQASKSEEFERIFVHPPIQFGDGNPYDSPAVDFTPNPLHQDIAETASIADKGKNKNAGTVDRLHGSNPMESYRHQNDAIKKLDKHLNDATGQFRGIVVIPTGGGKTRVAVDWLLRQVLDKKRKILWIAHREELLVQAWNAFCEQAYPEVLPNREHFQIRRVSGSSDQPIRIEKTDDVVIASVQSMRGPALQKVREWLKGTRPFLVIDEAHHAPARTYRQIIDKVCKDLNADLLGLTATPFRTLESEKGAIAGIFGEKPIYSIGLNTLIDEEILARPSFFSPKTNFSFKNELPEVWQQLVAGEFNLEALDEKWARQIGENATRNKAIVDHYCAYREKYGPTLVFALNVPNAIALNKLFKDRKVKSAVVVGDVRDRTGRHNISPKERSDSLDRFKKGELDVLVNVNVFTEGTDLPKVQTVFLTRPTTSKTLVMQMVGRALRGKKAGGTKEAFIVSFIDEWEDKIEWANAEQLFIDANADFQDKAPESRQNITRLVSIALLEKMAALLDASLPGNKHLQDLPFLKRVPAGLYSFSLLDPDTGADRDRTVLVYEGNLAAFEGFTSGLPSLLKKNASGKKDSLTAAELADLENQVRKQYFGNADPFPPVRSPELQDMIQHTNVYGHAPKLVRFQERDKFDVDAVARTLFEQGLGGQRKVDHLNREWAENSAGWQSFFGISGLDQFLREVNYANTRLERASLSSTVRSIRHETRNIERMSLAEVRDQFPQKYNEMSTAVGAKHRNAAGEYVCANCRSKSHDRHRFEMDHAFPFGEGGLTRLDNLQLLCVTCNVRKGAKV